MRSFLVGLLSLLFATASLAQSAGDVELIGLGGLYRSDCWVPMRIHIRPGGLKTGSYIVKVYQTDADGDQVVFTKNISVTGGESGGIDQRYWMYFQPQNNLPTGSSGFNIRDISKAIKVTLSTEKGKEIATLPVTTMLEKLDVPNKRGSKLVLLVTDGSSAPQTSDYGFPNLLGVMEDINFITLKASDLPDNPLGLQAADYVVWLNMDPAELHRGGDEKYQALQSWVKTGGQLVICTPADWQKMNDFGDLMPVTITSSKNATSLDPLRKLSRPLRDQDKPLDNPNSTNDKGPFPVAIATPLPKAVTEVWFDFDAAGNDRTPWLVRKTYGAGAVTWVAQDLGDRLNRTIVSTGWPNIWTRVLGLKDSPILKLQSMSDENVNIRPYFGGSGVDLGYSLIGGADLSSTSSLLITIAILFFLVYWIIAGPGTFVYLSSKKRSQHSWVTFGLCAVIATGLTIVIVRLVLRGPPQAKQVTYVRIVPGEPAQVTSRLGLYIPRDGDQKIDIGAVAPGAVSTLTSLPVNDVIMKDAVESKVAVEYTVPVRELGTEGAPSLTVPYRSTLKKFKVQWAGEYSGKIEGAVALDKQNANKKVSGVLTNGTGQDLSNIFIAFFYPGNGPGDPNRGDWLIYLPEWKKDVTLDLAKVTDERDEKNAPKTKRISMRPGSQDLPEANRPVQGPLNNLEWLEYFYSTIRSKAANFTEAGYNDSGDKIQRSFPVMSFFDHIPPMQNRTNNNDRADILRRGGRFLNVSGALTSGSMVILAQGEGVLPFQTKVEGDDLTAEGPIYYQFILPIDRTEFDKSEK